MERQIIRSIRKGTVQWNEEDRLTICTLLIKAGYSARIRRREIPGQAARKNTQMEYIVEYWEEEDLSE